MSRDLPEWTVDVASGDAGTFYIPAQQVTSLLRGLATRWEDWGDDIREAVLDLSTVEILTATMREVADQIDVACTIQSQEREQR